MTKPLRRTTSAVVSPTTPPGDDGAIRANWWTAPCGETSMIVEPVPCWLAWLLKLLTSTSPRRRSPTVLGTTAVP